MANYTLIANSQFKPFTYQDFLAPALMATQAHQELENQYSELSTKANVWENLANEQTDPNAYKMYKTYADDLNTQAEQLAREGLNVTSRKNMLNMRNRYSKEIVPIEQAYKRRQALSDEQRKLLAQNPTMLFQRNMAATSLDKFIDNPALDYGTPINGAMLTQQVANMASKLATQARGSEEGRAKLKKLLPYQYEYIKHRGFRPEDVDAVIRRDPNASQILTKIVDDVVTGSGVKDWGDAEALRKAYYYANQGAYSAIGPDESQMLTDQAGLESYRQALANHYAQQRQAANNASQGRIPINLIDLLSPNAGGSNLSKKIYGLASSLGLSGNLNGRYSKYVDIGHGIKVKLFNDKGILRSKEEILKDFKAHQVPINYNVKDPDLIPKSSKNVTTFQEYQNENIRTVSRYYDNIVKTLNSNYTPYNLNGRKIWQLSDISRQMKSTLEQGVGAYSMKTFDIKFDNPTETFKSMLPLVSTKDKVKFKEIEEFDKTGKLKLNPKELDLDDFYDADNDKVKGSVRFLASPNKENRGMIMLFNGKSYFINANNLGSMMNEVYNIDVPVLSDAINTKNQLIRDWGEAAYYSSKAGRILEDAIDNSGGAYVRGMVNAAGSSYKSPVYNVHNTSENAIP